MGNFFKKIFTEHLTSAILTVAAGILLTIFHSVATEFVCIAAGVFGVIMGVLSVISFLKNPGPLKRFSLLAGLVCLAIGIFVIVKPASVVKFVDVAFGILVIYHGLVYLMDAVQIKKNNGKYWGISLLFAIATLIAGIVLIILQGVIQGSVALACGIMLIVEGALGIWVAANLKKYNKSES